ncbi:hypothetical protein DLJ54_05315 [Corynebacterium heidelbergense]|uniref:Uncharacterized protein n=1 Tax=Corynebacterium heidelbergense TaxID=2055947 RepID=A0A364V5V1_9CORY|nr:hypothetical protein DLJ54_05315 [Corynebacterium heidelbergense]
MDSHLQQDYTEYYPPSETGTPMEQMLSEDELSPVPLLEVAGMEVSPIHSTDWGCGASNESAPSEVDWDSVPALPHPPTLTVTSSQPPHEVNLTFLAGRLDNDTDESSMILDSAGYPGSHTPHCSIRQVGAGTTEVVLDRSAAEQRGAQYISVQLGWHAVGGFQSRSWLLRVS